MNVMMDEACNDFVKDFMHRKIKSIVKDPEVAELLCPDYAVGCKVGIARRQSISCSMTVLLFSWIQRPCVDTNYYQTINNPRVKLVSIKGNPIKTVTKEGLITLEDGSSHGPFDAVITAIGFDVMTGSLDKIDITGRNRLTLKKAWEAGPSNYLGLFIRGFPNMYHIAGPGSPSVLSNMMTAIEQHVDWIADTIKDLDAKGIKTIEATKESQHAWVGHVNLIAGFTVWGSSNCSSWYSVSR